jgi:hypothetical protein
MTYSAKAREYDQDFIDANSIFDEDHESDLESCCGLDAHGYCSQQGTEWCDWKCPFNHEASHNNRDLYT